MDQIASTRVYKKTSANSVLTLYLGSRDLQSRHGIVEPLRGVIYLDPKYMCSQKIYGQLTLTFRYGREDEEVMGLKFCNEAVIAIKQIWPRLNYNENEVTPLQQALVDRLGLGAHPFTLEIGMLAPPSVQLVPAKKYNGAPIGTSYDIRIFMSDITDAKFLRRTTVKLGIRLMHKIPSDTRIIQQTNPTYTSLPKSIRLRLSPKQLKFHHHKSHSNCKSTSTTTTTVNVTATGNVDEEYNTKIDQQKILVVVDDMSKATISEGGTIRLPNAPTATANVATHPLTLNCSSSAIITETENTIVVGTTDPDDLLLDSQNTTTKGPERFIDKPFLWTEGRVSLKASLNKSAYKHGENVFVTVNIKNNSKKIVKKIRVFAVQHVDVCMFSNGKFKNVVADVNENNQIKPNESHQFTYNLLPIKGATKNWIAVEGTFSQGGSIGDSPTHSLYKIASSAHRGPTTAEDRNVFAIYVSYYVKVKLTLSGMGGEVSVKLPFILGYIDDGNSDDDSSESDAETEDKNGDRRDDDSRNDDGRRGDDIPKKKDFNDYRGDDDDDDDDDKRSESLRLDAGQVDRIELNGGGDSDNKRKYIKKLTSRTATIVSANNIIEEELLEDPESISLVNDDDDDDDDDDQERNNENDRTTNDDGDVRAADDDNTAETGKITKRQKRNAEKAQAEEAKFIQEKNLLHKYKLKRSSYSRSCEDIESFSRSDDTVKINLNNNSNNNNGNLWCHGDHDEEEEENSGDEGYLSCSRALCHRHSIEING